MVTTSDPALWSAMWSWKDHGKSWEGVYERAHPPGPRLVHDTFGLNGRMIEMQAAIGVIQLERMAGWTARRTELAQRLSQACAAHELFRLPAITDDVVHAWYRFYAFVRPERLAPGWTRERIIEAIVERGVPCFHGSAPEIYMERAFDGTPSRPAQPSACPLPGRWVRPRSPFWSIRRSRTIRSSGRSRPSIPWRAKRRPRPRAGRAGRAGSSAPPPRSGTPAPRPGRSR